MTEQSVGSCFIWFFFFVNQISFCLDPNLLLFKLDPKYLPGTDLMSKLVLQNQEVANIVVTTLIGK